MSLVNKIALSSLMLCMFLTAAGRVMAEEKDTKKQEESSKANGILFRIENIQPQKNSDGLIDRCKFLITAYNRMDVGVKSATMEFKWTDTISNKFKVDGDAVKAVSAKQATTVITKVVKIDTLGAHKQRSYEDVVETDKCFLLFDTLEYKVTNCQSDDGAGQKKASGKGGCADRFDYITTSNPEYYSEFKDVPDSVIEKQVEEEKKEEVSKIEKTVEKSLSELKEVSTVLEGIK